MKFGYTIIYVPNVDESLSFFENAFGFIRRFSPRVRNVWRTCDGRNDASICST